MLPRVLFARLLTTAFAIGIFVPVSSFAAEQPTNFLASKPSVTAIRIDVSEAPEIDGDLSDPAWAKAAVIDEFRQRSPDPGAPPTERTEARLMYDENNLYIGIYAYDPEPDQLVMRTMQRDGQIWSGDNIFVTLDPGPTWRNAYTFQIGASGGRQDALRLNNTREFNAWDTIWSVKTQVVSDGYIVEMAIPFRSLSYPPGPSDWGLEIGRTIRRRNEGIRWSSIDPAANFADVSQAGVLRGISNVNQGLGLDIQPYVLFGAKHNWQQQGDGAGITGTMGGNIFYKITPALTGTLTVNTDFSDAPLDTRQVNTTRFSLFYPETRDFFLQDAGAFEFGGRAYNRGNNDRAANNGQPFFSRNIGLANGQPVSIVVGGKVSGDLAGFEVGALSVLTDSTPTANNQLLSVARITHPIFEASKIGMIFTNGDPTGASDNTLLGGDFQYLSNTFLGNKVLAADGSYQRSFSNVVGDDDAFALALNYPNEPWGWDFAFKQLGHNFVPALGFANRTGIRLYEGNLQRVWRYRDRWLRRLTLSSGNLLFTGLDNTAQSRENNLAAEMENTIGDRLTVTVSNFFENIPEVFDIGDVPIPVAHYNWSNATLDFRSSPARPLSVNAAITCCAFYDGTNVRGSLTFVYRPSAYFQGELSYEPSFIDLPTGTVDIHILSAEGIVNFTPDMSLAFQVQYDNLSRALGSLARYRWEYSPGNELLIAFGQSADIPYSRFRAQTTQLTVRLVRTFQF